LAGRERCVRLAEGARELGEIESTETTREIEMRRWNTRKYREKRKKRKRK
jgi:hypothetical protein